MILTCKIIIHPDYGVQTKFWQVSCLCKDLWNSAIEQRQNPYSWGNVNLYTQKKELPAIKAALPEYKIPASQVLQNVLFDVDRAYQMFFTKKRNGDSTVRPPRYKSFKQFYTQEYSQHGVCFIVEGRRLRLAYGKNRADWLEIELPMELPGPAKTLKIGYQQGQWFACFTYDVPTAAPRLEGETIFFDPGCKTTLTGLKSNGEFVEYDLNPLREINNATYQKIDQLISARDKKRKGSYHWRRLQQQIQSLFSKIHTRTKTYLHTLAKRILDDHPTVKDFMIGDWNKQETLADTTSTCVNKRITRAVQNNNPVMKLIGYLTYKAQLRGQTVKKFDERGTTRTCVRCGYVHTEGIPPSQRTFACQKCDFVFPRDLHSCLNFVKRYLPALWLRLSGNLPDRRKKTVLTPFSFKPQVILAMIRIRTTGCSSF